MNSNHDMNSNQDMKDQEDKIGFLFDLDGVLIDSETEYTRIWTEIEQRFPTGIADFAIKIKGQTLPEILSSNFKESDHEQIVAILNEKEQKMRYPWLPGAESLLKEITEAGYEAVLVTSSNDLKMQHLREERPELVPQFKDIVTADKISRSKPDPEGYLLGASMLGVEPCRCVVFEDSRQGMKAGRSAGATVVGLTTTLPAPDIENLCDKMVGDLSEVNLEMIKKLIDMQNI